MASEKITFYRTNEDKTEVIEQLPKTVTSQVYDNENEQFLDATISDLRDEMDDKINDLVDWQLFNIQQDIENVSLTKASKTELNERGVSVKDFGAKGDGVTDDTLAIQRALDAGSWGHSLHFPEGTYKISDTLYINKPTNIIGVNHLSSKIQQTGSGKDVFHIGVNVERGLFHNIAIFGNNETIYGANQTTGKGIVLHENSVNWYFDRVWMRGHTYAIYGGMNGHVNNIIITNSHIEHCRYDGVHLVHGKGWQVNNVIIRDSNFSGHGKNGITVFGNNILIQGNTIQGNNGLGISLDCDEIQTIPSHVGYSAQSINIKDNYFEKCRKGYIYGKADYKSTPGFSMYLLGVAIEDNFGAYSTASDIDAGVTAYIKFEAPNSYSANSHLRFIFVKNNRVSGALTNQLDFGGVLDKSSVIYLNSWDKIIGVGGAVRIGTKVKTISGHMRTKDVVYNTWSSEDITTTKEILYNLELNSSEDIRGVELNVWSVGNVQISFGFRWMNQNAIGGVLTQMSTTIHTLEPAGGYKKLSWFPNNHEEMTAQKTDICLVVAVTIPQGESASVNLLNPQLYL